MSDDVTNRSGSPLPPAQPQAVATPNPVRSITLDAWESKGHHLGPVILPEDRATSKAADLPLETINACRAVTGLPPITA
jgi:hypothetical protein